MGSLLDHGIWNRVDLNTQRDRLFLLDPRALARIDPAALGFFQSGAYQLAPLHVEPVPEVPESVRNYLAIPNDQELVDELDSLLEDEIGPLE